VNPKLRGHVPRLVNTVTKREMCEVCGVSWLRGRPPLGPCPGIDSDEALIARGSLSRPTPVLGTGSPLRGGVYRGKVREGT
jgi:hypothetical protein